MRNGGARRTHRDGGRIATNGRFLESRGRTILAWRGELHDDRRSKEERRGRRTLLQTPVCRHPPPSTYGR